MPHRPPRHRTATAKVKRHVPEDSGESRKNWYKLARWKKLKKQILRRDPICTFCEKAPSTTVHHVIQSTTS
jgi:hypothetical protein